ncbi:succinylglutamate desuccinylase/aspartoacylase family protein [Marinobacter sp. CHS3-4]|uniref:succinylglutamate desuccinylase/aspartoacylase family protein n=1 Tax=Marinobacter sp. CHS3-4 TaxID=3045174 RepID=UPI0024B58ED5|nr:succinylglutamate desuccinylase/aspartoacylase family protein [Marinobacter sp. CHS3-4]MDI9244657.1 succinylglutamate desuccinylase/aspartoacylase family protein [Marinobacter sp. CHS3-4]
MTHSNLLDYLNDPSPRTLGQSPLEWLNRLNKPTVVHVTGRDRSRTRAMATLLHGNEPSGLFAIHRWLLEQHTPEVNMLFLIGGVYPAKVPPAFSLRQLPEGRDLNRCFKEPFEGEEGAIAQAMLAELHKANPECLLDVHNTSGTGPAFAVTITNDAAHQALTSLYTDRLIMTDLRLGALMEYSEQEVPTVTIECGGGQDDNAHQLAYDGLVRYTSRPDVLSLEEADWEVAVLRNPIRVELSPDATIEYRLEPSGHADMTFPPDIEHRNFGIVSPHEPLGWVGEKGLGILTAISHNRAEGVEQVLKVRDGRIYPAQAIKTFMITTNPVIAKSDCLFYAVKATGEPIF